MKTKFILIVLPALMIIFSSCARILLGVKNPKPQSSLDIYKSASRFGLPESDLYCSDPLKIYYRYKLENAEGVKYMAKDHSQPLQALYFDRDGKMISWQINCKADGSIGKMNWNTDHRMDQFPPVTATRPDTILTLPLMEKMIKPMPSAIPFSHSDYDYVVFVYWNTFMNRGARQLIRTIKNNQALAGNSRVKILWVNNENDYCISELTIPETDKALLDGVFK